MKKNHRFFLVAFILFLIILFSFQFEDKGDYFLGAGVIALIGYLLHQLFKPKARVSRVDYESNRHGNDKLATPEDLQAYTQAEKGRYIGKDHTFKKGGHFLTIAGTGAGKGRNLIVNNLLGKGNYNHSWFVIDPKGQNAFITKKFQENFYGDNPTPRKVIVLNPWQLYPNDLPCDTFNPFDTLDPNGFDFWDDCKMISKMIIPLSSANEQHWDDRARGLLTLTIAHMITDGQGTTLRQLNHLLSPVPIKTTVKIKDAEGKEREEEKTIEGIDRLFSDMKQNKHPIYGESIRDGAQQFLITKGNYGDTSREFTSILSTLQNSLERMLSPRIYENTQSTSFKLEDILQKRFALYVVAPSERLDVGMQWLRLVTTSIMRLIVRNRGVEHDVTFLLDEFASLGYMKEIETAMQQYRGYGINIWAILQSLSQLKSIYPKSWPTFLDCSSVQHYFGINSFETAEYLSKISGTSSYITYANDKDDSAYVWGQPAIGATARPVLTPSEAMQGSYDNIFCKIKGQSLAAFDYHFYDEDDEIKDRYPKPLPPELC